MRSDSPPTPTSTILHSEPVGTGTLRCWLFGHAFEPVAEVPSAVRYECNRCPALLVENRSPDTTTTRPPEESP